MFINILGSMLTTNITGVKRGRRLAALVVLCLLLFACALVPRVLAIARGYTSADPGMKVGMVASLTSDDAHASEVERATQENVRRIVGVVTNVDDSVVSVASSSSKVLVESDGQMSAYVSDIGGQVTKGSLLAISPIKGVLMAVPADSGQSVVGVAGEAAADKTDAQSYEIEDGTAKKSVKIVKIPINLNRAGSTNSGNQVDSSLSRLGKAIVGRDVSEIRVVLALLLFLIVLLAEGAIIYGAISSAITALGRNPLARSAIRREMIRILFVAVVVFLIGLAAIYGILWV
jgi:hypothetical protein